jgi:quercetin dioxygenase-like cupin family protein
VDVQAKEPTVKGPDEWFTGDVWIDSIVPPDGDSQLNIGAVHFTPGARTAWHSHAGGQRLYVTEGRGRVQSREVASQKRCKSGRAQVPRESVYAAAVTASADPVGTSSMTVGLKS